MRKTIGVRVPKTDPCVITKASEASWSYSCDSKVSFNRVQILTPDFSGRRPPPPSLPPPLSPPLLSPPPPLSSSLSSSHLPSLPPPSSQVPLRPVVALWHAVSVAYLAAALAHSHSHSLTVSLSHCLSHLSHLSHLSLLSLSAGGSGQRATYKGLFTPASRKSAVFFPNSLPSTFPFWSASFRPPLGLKSSCTSRLSGCGCSQRLEQLEVSIWFRAPLSMCVSTIWRCGVGDRY